jgi:hypothetical protein
MGISVSLVLPDVPASSSSSSSSAGTSDSTRSVDGEQTQQETVQETQQGTVPPAMTEVTKRTKSIAHDDWVCHQAMIFHDDNEYGGDACGVLQMSVVAYDPTDIKVVGDFMNVSNHRLMLCGPVMPVMCTVFIQMTSGSRLPLKSRMFGNDLSPSLKAF